MKLTDNSMRKGLLGIGLTILLAQFIVAMFTEGDFRLHHEFGRRLRTGESLYYDGMHMPYPPTWAVPHVPLSLVPLGVAKPAFLLFGFAAFVVLLWVLHDLSKEALSLGDGQEFWVMAAALFICSRFVIRDFDDGGQNIVLLCLSWFGLWLLTRRWPVAAGACVGLAIALKCTAGVFLLYFLAKREWKAAASVAVWTGLFFLTPMLWQGPEAFGHDFVQWQGNVIRGVKEPNPSFGILGPEPIHNRALRPSLARFLMRLPDGHPGRQAHPGYVDFLDFAPELAGTIIKAIMIAGLLMMGWLIRTPFDGDKRQGFQGVTFFVL